MPRQYIPRNYNNQQLTVQAQYSTSSHINTDNTAISSNTSITDIQQYTQQQQDIIQQQQSNTYHHNTYKQHFVNNSIQSDQIYNYIDTTAVPGNEHQINLYVAAIQSMLICCTLHNNCFVLPNICMYYM